MYRVWHYPWFLGVGEGVWNASSVDNRDYFTRVRTSAYEFGVGHNSAHNKPRFDANISSLTISNLLRSWSLHLSGEAYLSQRMPKSIFHDLLGGFLVLVSDIPISTS